MSEKNVRVLTEAEKYSGRTNGIPWDKFDEKVVSWGRLKYGERFSKALWRNELMSLQDLDLNDDLDLYKFEEHCALVNNVISNESPKYADSLLRKMFSGEATDFAVFLVKLERVTDLPLNSLERVTEKDVLLPGNNLQR